MRLEFKVCISLFSAVTSLYLVLLELWTNVVDINLSQPTGSKREFYFPLFLLLRGVPKSDFWYSHPCHMVCQLSFFPTTTTFSLMLIFSSVPYKFFVKSFVFLIVLQPCLPLL